MKNKSIIPAVLFCLMSTTTFAQLAMGKWRTHLAYNNVTQIAQSESKIYAVSDGALFSVDKVDKQFEFYSKVSGLNGSNISRIEFDQANKQLLIAYANGNIDLIGSGGVVNIPDLYNKQMSASKAINQVKFNDNKAYLSCDFGIVVLNMLRKEVLDTYYIGAGGSEVKVWNTTILNDTIYALTSTGGTSTTPYSYTLYKASVSNKQLVNFANWKTVANLPGTGDLQSIATFSNKLYILRGGKLWSKEGQNWSPFHNEYTLQNFNVTNGSMNLYAGTNFYLVNEALTLTDLSNKGNITDAEYDLANKTYWFAGNDLGILSYTEAGVLTPYKPASPAVNTPFEIKFSGQKMFVVPGGRWAFEDRYGNVMMYEKGEWTNISYTSIEAKTGIACRDLISTAIDPLDNKHFFAASYRSGLYEFRNNEFFKHHDYTNSTIEVAVTPGIPAGSVQYQMLGGSLFDKKGNLWILNQLSNASIKVLLKEGTWTQLNYPNFSQPGLGAILIPELYPNLKFVTVAKGKTGLAIFDDNGTITDQSDDKSRFFDNFPYTESVNGQSTIVTAPATYVSPIAEDKNGVIWVGTTTGPFIFSNLSKIFDADYTCSRIKIPRYDGTNAADYLLKDEEIKAIAIDGANRKWIGTKTSGAYLLNEKGDSAIQHFTTDNSPLLSNDIFSIAINPTNGEVFFGTGQGLISYQSDAGDAGVTFGDVYAYPNPVRQNFTGLITITGLIENTQVKITDLSGNLVCQTISNGSLATWDGKDIHGRKVSTGIYLALCASADGTQNTITKILVIN